MEALVRHAANSLVVVGEVAHKCSRAREAPSGMSIERLAPSDADDTVCVSYSDDQWRALPEEATFRTLPAKPRLAPIRYVHSKVG